MFPSDDVIMYFLLLQVTWCQSLPEYLMPSFSASFHNAVPATVQGEQSFTIFQFAPGSNSLEATDQSSMPVGKNMKRRDMLHFQRCWSLFRASIH